MLSIIFNLQQLPLRVAHSAIDAGIKAIREINESKAKLDYYNRLIMKTEK